MAAMQDLTDPTMQKIPIGARHRFSLKHAFWPQKGASKNISGG
jgi:hypothetical protein